MASSGSKMKRKKVVKTIIMILVLFLFANYAATIEIYDMIFGRYDHSAFEEEGSFPEVLTDCYNARQQFYFNAGKNTLQGYLYEPKAEVKNLDTMIVLAPGLHAGADDYLWQIQSFTDYGYTVFAFDPTGCIGSEGKNAGGFPQEERDIKAAVAFLEENQFFGCKHLVFFGHSRGAYSAGCLLDDYKEQLSAAVLVSGCNSAMEGVMETSSSAIGPAAYANYPFLWLYQTQLFGVKMNNEAVADCIDASNVPVMIVQGSMDQTFPVDSGSIASHMDEITSSEVSYVLCDQEGQNGHTDLLYDLDGTENDALMDAMNTFILENVQ